MAKTIRFDMLFCQIVVPNVRISKHGSHLNVRTGKNRRALTLAKEDSLIATAGIADILIRCYSFQSSIL